MLTNHAISYSELSKPHTHVYRLEGALLPSGSFADNIHNGDQKSKDAVFYVSITRRELNSWGSIENHLHDLELVLTRC